MSSAAAAAAAAAPAVASSVKTEEEKYDEIDDTPSSSSSSSSASSVSSSKAHSPVQTYRHTPFYVAMPTQTMTITLSTPLEMGLLYLGQLLTSQSNGFITFSYATYAYMTGNYTLSPADLSIPAFKHAHGPTTRDNLEMRFYLSMTRGLYFVLRAILILKGVTTLADIVASPALSRHLADVACYKCTTWKVRRGLERPPRENFTKRVSFDLKLAAGMIEEAEGITATTSSIVEIPRDPVTMQIKLAAIPNMLEGIDSIDYHAANSLVVMADKSLRASAFQLLIRLCVDVTFTDVDLFMPRNKLYALSATISSIDRLIVYSPHYLASCMLASLNEFKNKLKHVLRTNSATEEWILSDLRRMMVFATFVGLETDLALDSTSQSRTRKDVIQEMRAFRINTLNTIEVATTSEAEFIHACAYSIP